MFDGFLWACWEKIPLLRGRYPSIVCLTLIFSSSCSWFSIVAVYFKYSILVRGLVDVQYLLEPCVSCTHRGRLFLLVFRLETCRLAYFHSMRLGFPTALCLDPPRIHTEASTLCDEAGLHVQLCHSNACRDASTKLVPSSVCVLPAAAATAATAAPAASTSATAWTAPLWAIVVVPPSLCGFVGGVRISCRRLRDPPTPASRLTRCIPLRVLLLRALL